MYRECEKCREVKIKPFVNDFQCDEETFYYSWSTKQEERKTKGNEILTVKLTVKDRVVTTVGNLFSDLKSKMKNFTKHVHNIRQQFQSMKYIKTNLKEQECIIHIDFSENYSCKYADEVQSIHFGASRKQATMHTGVVYHRKPESTDVQCTSFCTISENTRNDPSAIWANLKPILHLVDHDLPLVSTLHFLSDGSVTQYRNKKNMYLFSQLDMFSSATHATWNFSESGHGKGAADGIGGSLKRQADKYVAQGHDIPDGSSLFHTLDDSSTTVRLFFINHNDIEAIDSILAPIELKAVPGTMNLHQLTW